MKRIPRWRWWRIFLTDQSLQIVTPWFGVSVSDRGKEWEYLGFWSGWKLYWGFGEMDARHTVGFNHYKEKVWFRYTREQYEDNGGFLD